MELRQQKKIFFNFIFSPGICYYSAFGKVSFLGCVVGVSPVLGGGMDPALGRNLKNHLDLGGKLGILMEIDASSSGCGFSWS